MGNWLPGLTRLFAVVCVFGVFLLGAGGVQEAEVVSFGGGEGYSSFQDIQGLPGFVPGEILVKFRTSLGGELSGQGDLSRLVEQVGIGEVRDRAGRLIRIRGVENVFARFDEQQERWEGLSQADSYGLNESEKRWLGRMGRAPLEVEGVDLGRIYRIEFDLDEGQSIEDALDAYRQCPEVEYAELNTIYSVNVDPNDPLYPLQWPLENVEQDYPASGRYNEPPGTYDKDMDASAAWDIHKGSRAVVIAVVDSGVDYVHRDLAGNMWVNELEEAGAVGVDDDGNGYIDDVYGYDFVNKDGDPLDDNGHGTHCSGIIAAVGNNGQDITGVCPGGRIMALKFLNSSGFGNTADAADAIYYAVNHGADVISNSWGGGGYTATMQAAINYAFSRGVIVVAAAGNDNVDTEQYPANYNHVLSVAATDSNDDKAVFSNYGDWIDLAAPGVDILSLLAEGTPFGTEYDDFTTIASGTSMACPQVAGACGLLFSVNPLLSEEQMFAILMETGDPIGGGICVSDSRVNLFNALSASVPATGRVDLDRDVYSSSSVLNIMLADADLAGGKDPNVWVASSGGDVEEVTLSAAPPGLGIFTGMVTAGVKPVDPNDGVVQVEHGEIITVSYFDVEDEGGSPVWVSDTAIVDNVAPIIISVAVDVPGQEPTLTFETDEPARVQVECGTSLVEPYDVIRHTEQLLTSHVINLVGVAPGTVYYFRIEATDAAGNTSVNDNGGVGFTFTTTGPGDVYVPGDYATIQTAIKSSWDGGMVWIADGIYTGVGNRDIEFLGRAITVQSVNGPENCIIDCEGTRLKPHRGFYFRGEEGADSVLEGVTIRNGYAPGDKGGGIRCDGSSPTINNCVMSDNIAYDENMSNLVDFGGFGGGMYNYHSNPVLTDCKFIGNRSGYEKYIGMINCGGSGGGMYNYFSDAILINCVFIDNVADFEDTVGFGFNGGGGGVFNYRSYPIITGCTFRGNRAETEGGGGGIYCFESGPAITDCMFVGNSAVGGGGGIKYQEFYYHHMRSTVNNCIFSGNSAEKGGGMYNILFSDETLTISNCTFSGNTAEDYVGGIYNSDSTSNININNCVLWGNRDNQNNIQIRPSWVEGVSYCCIQDDDPNDAEIFKGVGNIDDDPLFMDSDGDDNIVGTEDDNLHLQPGSPAIDAGDNAAVAQDYADQDDDDDLEEKTPWDFDGDDRFDDDPHTVDTGNDAGLSGVVDMGCYENPKNVFIFSSKLVTVPEGESAFFTVALLRDPNGSVEVTVLRRAGDEDIDVESGGILIFDSWNYDNPQTVTLSAEGDSDYFDGTAQFVINGAKTVTAIVNAIEYDSTPSVLYVDVDAPGAEDGTDWNNAFTDLQAALQFRADQLRIEQIRVAGGRYTPASPGGDREASFEMAEGLRIEGGYAGYGQVDPNDRDITLYETILSGDLDGNDSVVGDPIEMIDDPLRADNSFTVVTGNDVDETAVLDGFTISGGHNAQSSGGGVSGDYNSSVLLNCTIRGNWANPNGGGIYSFGTFQLIDCIIERNGANHNGGGVNGNATLVRCVVKENTAGNNGGGIYGNINLTDCEIRSNTADRGGGMYNRHSPIISNSIFIDNQADYNGGGVYNEKTMMISCMPTFNNCTFSFNRANDDGGGMYNRCPSFVAGYCQPVLNSCIFNYNVAVGDGGGICSDYSNPTLTNCIMHDNSATINGGGMYNTNSKQKLTNCTFAGNSAVSGNTLACVSPGKPSTLTISSSIFWDGGGAIANNDGSTIDMLYCDVQGGWPGTTNIETDPCFVDAGGGDFHLMSEAGRWDANMLVWREDEMTSACIDAGDPNMDWVGELWPDGGRVNMGVYGGTAEAGMSLNLVGNGADLNGDGVVDFLDWGLLGEKWMLREVLLKADVDRDGVVGLSDLWLFSGEWLWGK